MLENDEFEEVSSPVAGWTSIRLFLALTTLYNLVPLQLDINLAYLNAPLLEEIYMRPPPGSKTPPGLVWKLEKSLYGLRQSGKNWNELFTDVLKGSDFDFHQLGEDTCLFTRLVDDQITILFIYVDDIYIASSDPSYLEKFKRDLSTHFELKVLGVPQKLLGIQLQWAKDFQAVHLRAEQLIDELIKDHKIDVSNPEPTPMRADYRPRKADVPTEEERKTKQFKDLTLRYQQIVGSFIFISNTCRPDISYATNQLCRRMSCPNHADLEAAHHLVRYLAGTKDMGIGYRATGNRKPYFYADSDDGSLATLLFLQMGPSIGVPGWLIHYPSPVAKAR
jgi:hypothetical protein